MSTPFMPRGTAAWLIQHTQLTDKQIADFCGMHTLEIQRARISSTERPHNPISSGILSAEDIARCEADSRSALPKQDNQTGSKKTTKRRYVPMARRALKPHIAAWMLEHYSEYPRASVARFLGSTPSYLKKIEESVVKVEPKDPVNTGFCSASELQTFVQNAKKKMK